MELTTLRTTEQTTWKLHDTVKDENQADAMMRFYKEQVGYQCVKVQRMIRLSGRIPSEEFDIYVLEMTGGQI